MTQEEFLWWLSLEFYSFLYLTFYVCFSLPWNVCPFHSSDVCTGEFPVNDLFVSLGRETAGEMKETQREKSQSDDLTGETWLSKMLPQSNRQISYWKKLTWNKRFSSCPLLLHDWLIVFCSIDMRNSSLYISIYITLLQFPNNKRREDKIFHVLLLLLPVLEQVLFSRATRRTITKVVPFSLPDE